MKAIGAMDEIGRVVIPKKIRESMCLKEGTAFEIFDKEDAVIFKKYGVNEKGEERKEEKKEMEKNLIKITNDYEDKVEYVKLSKEATDFLNWMWDEGMLIDSLDFEVVDKIEIKEF